jgi:hypothetical protein
MGAQLQSVKEVELGKLVAYRRGALEGWVLLRQSRDLSCCVCVCVYVYVYVCVCVRACMLCVRAHMCM